MIDGKIIEKIKELRKSGFSFNDISRKLVVSKSTVYRYSYGVILSIKQINILNQKRKSSVLRMKEDINNAKIEARNILTRVGIRETAVIISILYWAEGNKKDLSLSNTDPLLIKTFIQGMIKVFNITQNKFKISIRVYEDLDKKECVNYWRKICNIEDDNNIAINELKGKKRGKLEYGMCRVRVLKGGFILKILKELYRITALNIVAPVAQQDRASRS